MIAIVDYGAGNLRSVAWAFEKLGQQAVITVAPEDIRDAQRIVLPGVGSFDHAMKRLEETGLRRLLEEEVLQRKKPVLGICLGFQMFGKCSEEGTCPGLGWLDADTHRLPPLPGLKIPHIGWNDLRTEDQEPLLAGLSPGACFYFAHSFFVDVHDGACVRATCQYGVEFCAIARKDNLFGVQFHPEKSHDSGLQLLRNFIAETAHA